MGDAGFFKGTSADQDTRFSDKLKKHLRSINFPSEFNQKVDMKKVNLKVIKGWIAGRISQLLGIEDEVVVEYAFGMLEETKPDPKTMQINLQGFLDKNSQVFVLELWKLLLSAQNSLGGIPQEFLDQTKEELLQAKRNKELELEKSRTQGEKERAVAAEVRQRAQALRESTRARASDLNNLASVDPPVSKESAAANSSYQGRDRSGRDYGRDSRRSRHDRSKSRDNYDSGRRNDRNRDRSRDRSKDRRDYRRDDYSRRHNSRRHSRDRSRDRSRQRSQDRSGRGHRDSYREDRGRDRYDSTYDDASSKRRRMRSKSRSRSQSRSRSRDRAGREKSVPRSRSRSGSRARGAAAAEKRHSTVSTDVQDVKERVLEAGAPKIDSLLLENQLREKLLRERVLQSVKNKAAQE